jgi:hypothetical protein
VSNFATAPRGTAPQFELSSDGHSTAVVVLIGANNYGLVAGHDRDRNVAAITDGTSNTLAARLARAEPSGIIAILIG